MQKFAMFALFAMAAAWMAGCTSSRISSDESVALEASRSLGRTVLVFEYDRLGPERHHLRKQAEVHDAVHWAVRQLPGTQIIERKGSETVVCTGSTQWRQRSEYELIECARQQGIDTVGLIDVARYVGYTGIVVLPPGWWAQTVVEYRMRLLDVSSGEVMCDVRRERTRGGYLGWVGPDTLRRDLRHDLANYFALAPPEE